MKEPGIFKNAHEALVFALHYSAQQYALSPMGKMMQGSGLGSGRGLVGLDGAGQAGMVMAELQALSSLERAALVGRYAPRDLQCDCGRPCCRRFRRNPEWSDAVRELVESAMTQFSGTFSHYRVRLGAVERYFGAKHKIQDIAEACGLDRHTVGTHNAVIVKWLRGIEHGASDRFDSAIKAAGMLAWEEA